MIVTRNPIHPVNVVVLGVHVAFVCVLHVLYATRYVVLASDPADAATNSAFYFTNWNFLLSSVFLTAAAVTMTVLPSMDSLLHLIAYPAVWSANVITLFLHVPVVASNKSTMDDGSLPWAVVYTGDKVMHVFICMWVFVYAAWRMNDMRWMWHSHGAFGLSVLLNNKMRSVLGSGGHGSTLGTLRIRTRDVVSFAGVCVVQTGVALGIPVAYVLVVAGIDVYGVPWMSSPAAEGAIVVATVAASLVVLHSMLVLTPPWEVRATLFAHQNAARVTK